MATAVKHVKHEETFEITGLTSEDMHLIRVGLLNAVKHYRALAAEHRRSCSCPDSPMSQAADYDTERANRARSLYEEITR